MKFYAILLFMMVCSGRLFAQAEYIFLADTQKPMLPERLRSGNEGNVEATGNLMRSIVRRKPAVVFLLGDMVSKGASNSAWKQVDGFLDALKGLKVPFYALKGNHEYMFNKTKGLANFNKRFPNSEQNVEAVVVGSTAVVLLNSNHKKLANAERLKMLNSYKQLMTELQQARNIKYIVVCAHHSPYTNSKVVSSSSWVQNEVVPTYISTGKAVLFLSGHSHNLELFKQQGKYFCVAGGGGGAKQNRREGGKQKYDDLLSNSRRFRFFYLSLQPTGNGLTLKAHGMNLSNEAELSIEVLRLE